MARKNTEGERNYAPNLRKVILGSEYTYKELADKIDVSQSALYSWAYGHRKIDVKHLFLLSEALDTSVDDIMGLPKRRRYL